MSQEKGNTDSFSPKTSLPFKTIKQAFEVNKNPYPWNKAIKAGISSAVPALIGLMTGNLHYGLIAGIGGFTYLYMFNEPYAQRAKKLFFVMIGLSASIGLGTLFVTNPPLFALMVGLIGFLGTFIFGTLKIPGPAAVFFVLVFTISSAMPVDPSLAFERSLFVLLGGAFAWMVAMVGWFFNPHGPEINAMKRVYRELGLLVDSVGTEKFSKARKDTLQMINNTGDILHAGYFSWDKSLGYKKLYYLYEHANRIFSEVLDFHSTSKTELDPQFGDNLRLLANAMDKKGEIDLPAIDSKDELAQRLATNIVNGQSIINEIDSHAFKEVRIKRRSLKAIFSENFHKNSFVFVSAIKYGIILLIAAIIAFSFDFDRSYWIPLSCAAIMLGSTILATFHRAIQRSFGTIIGIIIATLLLSTNPDGIFIVIIILCLTFLTELFIPLNYAIAVSFITPNAIFMAENTTQIYNVGYFATARLTDILIGSAIGLIGTLIIGRGTASGRLPHLVSKTIRSQMQLLVLLFSDQDKEIDIEKGNEVRKAHTNISNLSLAYRTALGEIPNDKKRLGHLWPAIYSIEQLGYLLDSAARRTNRPCLDDKELAQLLLAFEMMAQAVKSDQPAKARQIPNIPEFPQIRKEIVDLQMALQIKSEPPKHNIDDLA